MANKSSDGPAADLGSLLGIRTRRQPAGDGCWPDSRPDRSGSPGPADGRGCWPDPDDLNRGETSPAEAIRKIVRRGRWI
jgi:hypothetical protein